MEYLEITAIVITIIVGLIAIAVYVWKGFGWLFNFNRKSESNLPPKPKPQASIHKKSTDNSTVASGHGSIAVNANETVSITQSIPPNQIVLTEDVYKQNLENAVKAKQVEMQNAQHSEEKELIQKEIDAIKNTLSNLPESVKDAHERIDKIETTLTSKGNKIGNSKLIEAQNALNLGIIAEKENRLLDAMKHYTLAAKLHPRFDILTHALSIATKIGDFSSTLFFAEKAEKAAIKESGEGSKDHADSLNNLGSTYSKERDYQKSEQLCEQALKIYKNIFGDRSSQVSFALIALAGNYMAQNKNLEAEKSYKESLEICQEVLGKEHPKVATSLSNFGKFYYHIRKYEKAESCFNDALNIRTKVLGETHPKTASSFSDIALVYDETNQYEKAESFYKKAIKIYENEPVQNPHGIVYPLNNLAWLYFVTKRYDEAEPLYKRAVEIFETSFAPNHKMTKTAKGFYGMVKKRLAEKANAESVASQ